MEKTLLETVFFYANTDNQREYTQTWAIFQQQHLP